MAKLYNMYMLVGSMDADSALKKSIAHYTKKFGHQPTEMVTNEVTSKLFSSAACIHLDCRIDHVQPNHFWLGYITLEIRNPVHYYGTRTPIRR